MSSHSQKKPISAQNSTNLTPLTALNIQEAKGKKKITVITAYDYPSACIVDAAGIDIVLVGDSLGMVVLGNNDTINVSLDTMIHHAKSVVAGIDHALVVVDMPFMTYTSVEHCLQNAMALVQASGARAVKIEGGTAVAPQVKALVQNGIATMGHIGLTPQQAATLGGFKVQGKTLKAAENLIADAKALEEAGCFSIVIEAVPALVGEYITKNISIPTIGIGAGPACDGQVLVLHDMLGMTDGHVPKFVKQFANIKQMMQKGVEDYIHEVLEGTFPNVTHCFTMPKEDAERIEQLLKNN